MEEFEIIDSGLAGPEKKLQELEAEWNKKLDPAYVLDQAASLLKEFLFFKPADLPLCPVPDPMPFSHKM